jgi:hypothetical protein
LEFKDSWADKKNGKNSAMTVKKEKAGLFILFGSSNKFNLKIAEIPKCD